MIQKIYPSPVTLVSSAFRFLHCSLAFGSGLSYYSNGRQSGKHLDNFSWGEVPNCVIKYLCNLHTIIFDEEEKCFPTLLKDLNVSRK